MVLDGHEGNIFGSDMVAPRILVRQECKARKWNNRIIGKTPHTGACTRRSGGWLVNAHRQDNVADPSSYLYACLPEGG
jgi:hypothetical protein